MYVGFGEGRLGMRVIFAYIVTVHKSQQVIGLCTYSCDFLQYPGFAI